MTSSENHLVALYKRGLTFFQTRDPLIYTLLEKAGQPSYLLTALPRGLFSWLIGGILGQKIRFKKAQMLRMKLYTKAGNLNFSPQDIQDWKKKDWLDLGAEEFQIEIIKNVIEAYQKKEIKFDGLDDLDNWKKIKGIGPWTLNNIMIMYSVTSLKKIPEILLVGDLVVKSALKSLYDWPKLTSTLLDKKKLEWINPKTQESYLGLINWYLWRHWRTYQKEILVQKEILQKKLNISNPLK